MKDKNIKSLVFISISFLILTVFLLIFKNPIKEKISRYEYIKKIDSGNYLLMAQDYENAIDAYSSAIRLDSQSEEAYIALADAYIMMENYDYAKNVLYAHEMLSKSVTFKFKDKLNEVLLLTAQESEINGELLQDDMKADSATSDQVTEETGPIFIPWVEAGLTDHPMEWQDKNLEAKIQELTGITDREIMLSDVWEIKSLDLNSLDAALYNYTNLMITNISNLQELKNLQELDLSNNTISDINALKELVNLVKLNLDWNQIVDLDALSGLNNLHYLKLSNNELASIKPLNTLTELTNLYMDCDSIGDLSPLIPLAKLEELSLATNSIVDITPLGGLANLKSLNLSGNEMICDISILSNLTKLEKLSLAFNTISDISVLGELTNLTELNVINLLNSISEPLDINSLSSLTKMKKLDLSYNGEISGINALSNMTELESLNLTYNNICDISLLGNLNNLTSLNLSFSCITDISALSNLTKLDYLCLWGNDISDYSPVEFVPHLDK